MIPQFTKALSSGFTPKSIVDFLISQYPSHKEKIKQALAYGYTAEQVMTFLGGGQKELNRQKSLPNTEYSQIRQEDIQQNEDINKGALTAGALGATALAAPIAGQVLSSAMQRALPQSLSGMIGTALPGLNPGNNQNATTSQAPSLPLNSNAQPSTLTSQPPVNAPSIPQVPNTTQPEGISSTSTEPNKLTGLANMLAPGDEKSQEEAEKVAQKLTKNSTVIAPQGVGEVKEIRNGKAIVEIDGKRHQIDEDELESSPIPEKDLADLYDELIEGIEGETGEDVSRMVQWAGYNPETNTLQFLPHTGKLYKYGNISEEDAALLTDILSTRKTSGSNFIGAWKAGSKSPIGAALSKLIRKLQSERGGKGNEYEETHEPIYSAYEPAIEAKKRKKKKK